MRVPPRSAGLAPELRHLLNLFVIHGLTVKALSRLLGISEPGIRAMLGRARILLQDPPAGAAGPESYASPTSLSQGERS